MKFEQAIAEVKEGKMVSRENWKGLRVLMSAGNLIQLTDDEFDGDDYEFNRDDYDEETVDDEFQDYMEDLGYSANSADMQANDWVLIN